MSASTTPTERPRVARATARFTVTLDLPTPPLPEATAYTRVSEPGWENGITGSAASVPRTVRRSSARCSSLITSSTTCTEVTPGTAETAWVTRLVMVSRIGQPETVRYTSTRTVPSAPTCTSLTMPSSGSGRLISGSCTVARAALTASSAGESVIVSDIVASVSFDEGTRIPGRDPTATCASGSSATVRRGAGGAAGRQGDLLRTR